mmetsp:Transcript_30017/g.42852  ORF Transcript_30017/g.42852 Transcript_30017/m.42852 type:complete len:322 (-) Transcript_30017:20-985(-)
MDRFVVKFTANENNNNKKKKTLLDNDEIERIIKKPKNFTSNSKLTQMFIDYGQKSFGKSISCPICGMIFVINDDQDIKSHGAFCKSTQEGNILNITKGFQIIDNFPSNVSEDKKLEDSILLGQSYSTQYIFVMKDVLILLEKELGLSSDFITIDDLTQSLVTVLLYMRGTKLIGCIIVEDVLFYRLYHLKFSIDENNESSENNNVKKDKNFDQCDKKSFLLQVQCQDLSIGDNVALGIRALWVSQEYRRQGIAQCLVDAARKHVRFGRVVAKEMVAISDPTMDGFYFLTNYTGSNLILSYSPKTTESLCTIATVADVNNNE